MILAQENDHEEIQKILKPQAESLDTFNFNLDIEPLTEEFFKRSWIELEEFLKILYNTKNKFTFCFQYFYELVGSLSNHSIYFCEQLTQQLQFFHSQHFSSLLEQVSSSEDDFSDKLAKEWVNITHYVGILSEVFKEFEVCYLTKQNLRFEQFIIKQLADVINTQYSSMMQKIISNQLDTFNDIREGNLYDKIKLENLLSLTRKTGAYESQFKQIFLEKSEDYYKQLSSRYHNNQQNIDTLLNEIDLRLRNEKDLIQIYLSNSIGVGLIEIVQNCLIRDNLKEIFDQGFVDFLNKKEYNNVTRVYWNILIIDQFESLKHNWSIYVKNRGESIINMENKDDITSKLLDYFKELEDILVQCFQNSELLITSKNNALEEIFSNKYTLMAELTSKYIDNLLKKATKDQIKNELQCFNSIENVLKLEKDIDNIMQLFRYLPEKEIFIAFYDQLLIKRVLMNNSYSYEFEKLVLDKLKAECGEQFACKTEEIIKDIERSTQLNEDFNNLLFKNLNAINLQNIFYINVVSSAAWPIKNMQLPSLERFHRFFKFNEFQRMFDIFYSSQNKGVGLKWQNAGSTCQIEGRLNQNKGLILLSFNFKNQHSFGEFRKLIPIEKEELQNNLISLYAMKEKSKLLNKTGDVKEQHKSRIFQQLLFNDLRNMNVFSQKSQVIQDGDIFEINENYKSTKQFVKLNFFFKNETVTNILKKFSY